LKINIWDDVSAIIDVVKKWKPRNCKTEKEYETSLYRKLKKYFPLLEIIPQYKYAGVYGNLVVGNKVLIEIKTDLESTATLLGQLMRYKKKWDGRILVLLTGNTNPGIVKELEEFVDREGLGPDLLPIDWPGKVTIFKK